MTVRLRYMGHLLEVPEGEFIVGRSSTCQLSLDDALVSRRHAALTVSGGAATVEDLGSRNGVLVNNRKIKGATPLADGDVIKIGSQEMTIQGLKTSALPAPKRRELFETMTAGVEAFGDEPTHTNLNHIAQTLQDPDKRVHELSLIGAVAEKALHLGRADDAARLLDRPMKELLARVVRTAAGEEAVPVDDLSAKRAIVLALKLAAATSAGEWVDFVIELSDARDELLSAASVDELYTLVRGVRVDITKLRTYLAHLHERAGSMNKNERFLLSRLEGLVELALV